MLALEQMVVLFILMGIGFGCGKLGKLSDDNAKFLSWLVVNVGNPAIILSASINGTNTIKGKELAFSFGVAVGMFALSFLIAQAIPFLLKVPRDVKGVYKAMTIFSNIGFMGLPIVQAMFGTNALLYAALFQFPYSFLIYTYGIVAISIPRDDETSKQKNKAPIWQNLKKAFNVGVISSSVSLIIYLAGIKLPAFIGSTVDTLSHITAPLSMIVIGHSLIHMEMKKLFTDVRLIVFSGIKLLLIPICVISGLRLIIDNELLLDVCMVMLSVPVGSMTAMLAQQYDGNYELASKGVAITTILSVITLPIVAAVVL